MKRNLLKKLAAATCLVLLFGYLLVAAAVRMPFAAAWVSRLVTGYLQYPFVVDRLALTGTSVSVESITLGHPPPGGLPLASCRQLVLTPDLAGLLRGKKSLTLLSIRGLQVSARKTGEGHWNFEPLARQFLGKKGGGDIAIKRLVVNDSLVEVQGTRLDNLSLDLHDLSTAGTSGARFLLTCTDGKGNPLRIEGSAVPGATPAADIRVSAPSLSLDVLGASFKLPPALSGSTASIALAVKMRHRTGTAEGEIGLRGAALRVGTGTVPVAGQLTFSAAYGAADDSASVTAFLHLNDLIRIRGAGALREVTGKRRFEATLSAAPISLAAVHAMLPQELRYDTTVTGTIGESQLRLRGDAANGITAGTGTVALRGGELVRQGHALAKDVTLDATLRKVPSGWQTSGRLAGMAGQGVVQLVEAPFTALFSPQLKLLDARVPRYRATVLAAPATGELTYRPGAAAPLSLALGVRGGALAKLNRFTANRVQLASGTANLSVQGTGGGPAGFNGSIGLDVSDVKGTSAGKLFTITAARLDSRLQHGSGTLSTTGHLRLSGVRFDGREGRCSFSYASRDRDITLSDMSAVVDGTEVSISSLRGIVPVAEGTEGTPIPLQFRAEGVTARNGGIMLTGLSANLSARLLSGQGTRWIEGTGGFSVSDLLYHGRKTGSVAGQLTFGDSRVEARVDGTVLGGGLKGTVTVAPLTGRSHTTFALQLRDVAGERLAALLPDAMPVTVAKGLLRGSLTGSHGGDRPLQILLQAEGKEIALARRDGRSALQHGAVHALLEYAGDTLVLRSSSVQAGALPAVTARGEIARPFSRARHGQIVISCPPLPVDSLLTVLINNLPKTLQESSGAGTAGAGGTARIAGSTVTFDGTVTLDRAGIEVPGRRFSVTGVTGTIPLSFDRAAPAVRPKRRMEFSRERYPQLRAALKGATARPGCTIGNVRLGDMEMGETSLVLTAANGMIELVSLESSLFGGTVLGNGFFSYGDKMQYGLDLTIGHVSLRELCNTSPAIRGYITGKLDGIVSLLGEEAGVKRMRGFTELWTYATRDEKMMVSREFLQKLAGKKLKGLFFRSDRPYDSGEIRGYLKDGYLTFDRLDISHTNLLGIRDLSVTVAPVQNRITLDHLITAIGEAAHRGKASTGPEEGPPVETDFKWQE